MRIPRSVWWSAAVLGLCLLAPVSATAEEGAKPAAPKQPAPKQPAPKQPAAPPKAPAPVPKAPEPAPEPEPAPPPYEFLDEGLIEKEDGTVVYFYRTNFVKPKDLLSSLTKLLPVPGVSYKEFGQQNILIIEGEAEDVDLALEAAAYFDVSAPQVFIEAKVIEITYDSNFEFGLDYLWSRDAVGPNTLFRGAEGVLNPTSWLGSQIPGGLPFQGTSLLFGFVGTKAEEYGLLDVTLQALQMDGKAEVLSKPSVITAENVEAIVSTTEDRQIIQLQNADRNNERYSVAPLVTGVTMKVKPLHIGESFVTLNIAPEVRGVQGSSTRSLATLRPILTTRKVTTTVTMADGETLVIGGLYTHSTVNSKAKTPLLSDIPLLGCLFTRSQEAKAKTELVFMLKPTIVRKGAAGLKIVTPPAELVRLEDEGDCFRPAGPSLGCPEECKEQAKKPAPPPPPPPCGWTPVPPPVTSSPSYPKAK
mgnify:CR=1 FL=1